EELAAPKAFLTHLGADHGGYLEPGNPTYPQTEATFLDWFRWSLYGDTAARDRLPSDAQSSGTSWEFVEAYAAAHPPAPVGCPVPPQPSRGGAPAPGASFPRPRPFDWPRVAATRGYRLDRRETAPRHHPSPEKHVQSKNLKRLVAGLAGTLLATAGTLTAL